MLYGVGVGEAFACQLFGIQHRPHQAGFFVFDDTPGNGNETAFLFEPDGRVLAVGRKESTSSDLCRSQPPYAEWQRTELDRYIGGPLVVKWAERYLVGGRMKDDDGRGGTAWLPSHARRRTGS